MDARFDRPARLLLILVAPGCAAGSLLLLFSQWRSRGILSPALAVSALVFATFPFLIRQKRRS